MSGAATSFVPGLVVLALGLAAGLFWALRVRRRAATTPAPGDDADRQLEITDLLGRRDEIYGRLSGQLEESLGEDDRHELELQAARILKRLDELAPSLAASQPATAASADTAHPAPAPAPAAAAPLRTALVSFGFGVALTALVGMLVYWANRDAAPAAGTPAQAAGTMPDDDVHSRLAEMSPEGQRRATALLARLSNDPTDLMARKALTETYVMEGQFFEAFEQTEVLLEQSPGDVDGLYFQGLIRMTMGQHDEALDLLGQAIDKAPDFVSARLVRGITRLRIGDRDGAIEDWRAGLDAAGGSHQSLEQLIRMAEAGASAEEILSTPPPGSRTASQTTAPTAAPPPATPSAPSRGTPGGSGSYRARLELAPGAAVPPGATLFVFLRGGEGGPPSAVKRLPAAGFPLEVVLDARDSMLGRPLPSEGTLSARIDSDGSASTHTPGDLAAQADVAMGRSVTLVLKPAEG